MLKREEKLALDEKLVLAGTVMVGGTLGGEHSSSTDIPVIAAARARAAASCEAYIP